MATRHGANRVPLNHDLMHERAGQAAQRPHTPHFSLVVRTAEIKRSDGGCRWNRHLCRAQKQAKGRWPLVRGDLKRLSASGHARRHQAVESSTHSLALRASTMLPVSPAPRLPLSLCPSAPLPLCPSAPLPLCPFAPLPITSRTASDRWQPWAPGATELPVRPRVRLPAAQPPRP